MTFKKIPSTKTLIAILITASLNACVSPDLMYSKPSASNGDSTSQSTTQIVNQAANNGIVLLDKKDALVRLVSEDDYISALSPFDWQAKFKSDRALTQSELRDYYAKAVIDWDAKSMQKVIVAVNTLNQKIASLNLNKPDTLKFILTNGLVESGAAYTREDYIVLPLNLLDNTQSQEDVNHLVAHEFFHVYSRYNKAQRDKLYGSIGFKKLPPVALPSTIKSLLITNPDAPSMGYGIDLDYQGKKHTFLPLIVAKMPYDKKSNLSFFAYVTDGLLAVDNAKGVMRPALVQGAPVFVPKTQTNYDAVVQPNSPYLNHPEEVLAENFAMWVVDETVAHKAPVNKLIATMQNIQ